MRVVPSSARGSPASSRCRGSCRPTDVRHHEPRLGGVEGGPQLVGGPRGAIDAMRHRHADVDFVEARHQNARRDRDRDSDVMLGARAGTVARTWPLMLSLTKERSGSSSTVFFTRQLERLRVIDLGAPEIDRPASLGRLAPEHHLVASGRQVFQDGQAEPCLPKRVGDGAAAPALPSRPGSSGDASGGRGFQEMLSIGSTWDETRSRVWVWRLRLRRRSSRCWMRPWA